MSMDAIALAGYLGDLNVRAFLAAIRLGEGTKGPDGYRTMFTGKLFDSYDDHPRQINHASGIDSTAAGAYQFLSRTWDGLVKQYGFTNFEPRTQDIACIALIHGRKALDDVVAGRIEQAVLKCNKEWASLPGSPYGQPVVTMEKFIAEYKANGGTFAPVVDHGIDANQFVERETDIGAPLLHLGPEPFITDYDAPKEQPMTPFLMAALPALIDLVPKLGSIFASGSATAQRNVKAAEIVVEAAKSAIGATNEQDLVERIKKDPAAATTAKQAIESVWFQLQEVAGGVEAARKADAAAMQAAASGVPFWKSSPSFWVAVALLPLVYMIVANVVGVLGQPLSDEVRSAIANGVVGLILGGLIGYYYGQSASRNRPAGA